MAKRLVIVSLVAIVGLALGLGALTQPWLNLKAHTVSARPVKTFIASSSSEPSARASATPQLIIGTADQPAPPAPRDIQGEIDAARASGGVVQIPAGNWLMAATLNVWANITLEGSGPQSCLTMRQPATDMVNIAGSNVTIQDLCLVGPGGVASRGGNGPGKGIVNLNKTVGLRSVTVRRLRISGTQGHAIELYGSPRNHLGNVTIEANTVSRAGGHGVVAGFVDGGLIDGNVVVDSALGGMTFGDGAINIEGSTALTVQNNAVDGSMYSGIQANSVAGSVFRKNIVTNTRGSGFAFWNCSGDTFTQNRSIHNTDQGYYWALNGTLPGVGANDVIQGNLAQNNGKNGFQLVQQTDVQFTANSAIDNNADNTVASGLMIQQHSSVIKISGNTFKNTTVGTGQLLGVHDLDHTAIGLSVLDDNSYFQMRVANVQL